MTNPIVHASLFLAMLPLSLTHANESSVVEDARQDVVQRTNAFRKQHQLDPLASNPSLQAAAEEFAKFMASTEKYGHTADGSTPAERAKAEGYDYCVVRENIAYRIDPTELSSEQLAEKFTQGWIDSPEHRENMLADYITETGVAIATTDGETFFAVQLLGRPKSMAYQVRLTNRTSQTYTVKIESNGGIDDIEVAPRVRLRMQRCFPITLSLEGTKIREQYRSSQSLLIEPGDDGPMLIESEPDVARN